MDIRNIIIQVAEGHKTFKHADIIPELPRKVSRQYLSNTLGSMVKEGILLREMAGRNTVYALPKNKEHLIGKVTINLLNDHLEEHIVWDSLKDRSPILQSVKENIFSILDFAFQEMMNNAIEHSKSPTINAYIYKQEGFVCFEVRDSGMGVFRNIMTRLGLDSELEAMQELLKGKTTTHPQIHTGQGIFFTSKVADLFRLDSYGYRLTIDNLLPDIFVEKLDNPIKGTRILFKIAANSSRHAEAVFRRYHTDPENIGAFDKTEIPVKLFSLGTIYVSRSQARRVMVGLNKFKCVILDFDKVPTIGQSFADEVFRVWHNKHPDIEIRPINMNEAVKFMVDRVES